jgi:hypothetical protein
MRQLSCRDERPPGAPDLVVLGDELEVETVTVGGEWTGSGRLFHR